MSARTLADAWRNGRNNFNLIRLVAAWMVIYGHAWAITGSPGQDWVTWLTQFKYAGAVAVDVFFFISGLLIASSLERNPIRNYLLARALRILPALLVCVVLCVCVLGPLLTTASGYWHDPQTWRYLLVNASLWSTSHSLPGVFETLPYQAVNGSLWTLPGEARLYLALLLASVCGLLTPRRYTPLWALAMAAAYGFAVWRHPLPEMWLNYLWCTACFITGTLCWVNRDHLRLSAWPLLVLLALACAARGTPWFHLPYFGIVCYGTLWLAFVPALPLIRRTDLSYGLYLYGWPMAQLVQTYSPGGPLHNTLWATMLALSCAAASWFLIESPALRWKRRITASAASAAA
jgi:peptidoglycan/LPS O-acetylase OafA/YrhL